MKGGVKFYHGPPGEARAYVEAERSRADDYYLKEGDGYARRLDAAVTLDGEVAVRERGWIEGDAYEAWVAGVDPDTGEARGRLRNDKNAVRFVEVIVNGPKSWSLAAELHEDIAAAYEQAQDRAAEQIVKWVGQHATTRVGPRGGQVSTPVEYVDAVAVRHYTNRAGDPHRHLHLQINSRVRANGKWYGIDTVAVRNSIPAMQGIGHGVVVADPEFRAALAQHGFALDEAGEVRQLQPYLGRFSRRAEQVARQIDRYEAEWRAANPDQEPGPGLWRVWDARAWKDQRPDKGIPVPAAEARARWVGQLRELGFRTPRRAVAVGGDRLGAIDRDAAAAEVVARLGMKTSAWNHPDLRGETEQYVARTLAVADAATRREVVDDITARAADLSVPLLDRAGVPDHIRALTSLRVLAVEAEVTGRLAMRGAVGGTDAPAEQVAAAAEASGVELDARQAEAVAALAGDHELVVVHGAAGAGKTTTLATTKQLVEQAGHAMVVVTPTLKAANVASRELGTHTGSAAKLAHAHGWRWDDTGWQRLVSGQPDPTSDTGKPWLGPRLDDTHLDRGDLLVIDEAGMLDQDTARALFTLADEAGARVALLGDPHQLPAVGRGGVLDAAQRWSGSVTDLTVIHRFTRQTELAPGITATEPDVEYAELSLAMRHGDNPAAVFDQLLARGQVTLYPTDAERDVALAQLAATNHQAGRREALVVDTLDQVHTLNVEIRARLVDAGVVDDHRTTTTDAGQGIGAGDLIATRRNNTTLDVANRDTWTVTAVHRDGQVTVTPAGSNTATGERELTPAYVREHVELAYATTTHGVQGDTLTASHVAIGDTTSAANAYVGMTRGRENNTAHLVAADVAEARELWVDVFGRGRPDLGTQAAREAAERAASQYAQPQPATPPSAEQRQEALARLVEQLRDAWLSRAAARDQLAHLEPALRDAKADAQRQRVLAPLDEARTEAWQAQQAAEDRAQAAQRALEQRTGQLVGQVREQWRAERPAAHDAATVIQAGPGRFGRHRGRVETARTDLDAWAGRWAEAVPDLADPERAVRLAARESWWDQGDARLRDQLAAHAEALAHAEHPEHVTALADAATARQQWFAASKAYHDALSSRAPIGNGWPRALAKDLPRLTQATEQASARYTAADQQLRRLASDPLIAQRPIVREYVTGLLTGWQGEHDAEQIAQQTAAWQRQTELSAQRMRQHEHDQPYQHPGPERGGPGIGI